MWRADHTEHELRCGYEALRLERQRASLACCAGAPDSSIPPFGDALRDPLWSRLVHLHTGMLARGIQPAPLPGVPFDTKRAAAGERVED